MKSGDLVFLTHKKNKKPNSSNELSRQISEQLRKIAETPIETMTTDEYLQMREDEKKWFNSHYNFENKEEINAIPNKKNLPELSENGVTGKLYYNLKEKAYEHEKVGEIELAIACMKKSVEISKQNCFSNEIRDLEYSLIGLLARSGYVKEAELEKAYADKEFIERSKLESLRQVKINLNYAHREKTDLVMMGVHAHASSEMAIYQGRVYSISGKNSKFPKLPDFIIRTGELLNGESVVLYPYLEGVTSPNLAYILKCNPIKRKKYTRNIVAFSNRPFEDDRPDAYKEETQIVIAKLEEELHLAEDNRNKIIQIEAERGINKRNYKWIQKNIPDKCPKSYSGYMRMKNGKTKNFLILQNIAEKYGRKI